ncbi:XRE family transcriptional regulator [Vibrio anguillarum]|uniref:XRE family transcriptional regulator n=2 Tax=Vibrio TaxID=662 RepID=A0ABD4QX41_VIBAN|nr:MULTISPECIES: XRE family transcriptional regulator [Vibrio]EAZ73609.1 prophage MuSo2, transcriptional regulator, Cro/CI family [Vibrio cholerae NCTC 8457]CAH8242375.1 Peptidase_S24 domain-containing protein [Vibrio aestuarianus]APF79503.1 prophage MuSo2, transcriptional regulator, Cro/CI family [Vibrio cholerae]MBF4246638.1 XRE family transcriptional regulator [Vibrio anguillarum]MBT2919801.1 XRE family transcriptional regulator [Vibrio anguillarum]
MTYKEKDAENKKDKKRIIPSERIIRFKERLVEVIGDEAVLSFAKKSGMSEGVMRSYIRGDTFPSLDRLEAIANAAEVDLNWLATGKEATRQLVEAPVRKDNVVEVVQYDFRASAGAGCLIVSENPVAKFEFSREWLIKQGLNGKHLTVVEVYGDSMEPTLMDEDLMLVEVVDDPKQARDGVCVFRIDDEVMVKRVQYDFASGGYHVTSDNTAYSPFFIGKEFEGRFQLLGRMVRVLQRAKKA